MNRQSEKAKICVFVDSLVISQLVYYIILKLMNRRELALFIFLLHHFPHNFPVPNPKMVQSSIATENCLSSINSALSEVVQLPPVAQPSVPQVCIYHYNIEYIMLFDLLNASFSFSS